MIRSFRLAAAAAALTVGGAFAAAPATAQTVSLGAVLNGAQQVPPVATPATGSSSLFYNQATGAFTVTLTFANLTGTTVGVGPGNAPAHIHLAPPGVNGPIVIPLVGTPIGVTSAGYSNTFTFGDLLGFGVPAGDVAALQTQLNALVGAPVGTVANLYANVHTTLFPNGEIRGNMAVVPEPSTYALVAAGAAGLGLVARRRRRSADATA
jgi:hypothetical protein